MLAGRERRRADVADQRRVSLGSLFQLGRRDVDDKAFEAVALQELELQCRPRAATQLAHLSPAQRFEPPVQATREIYVRPLVGRQAEGPMLDRPGHGWCERSVNP